MFEIQYMEIAILKLRAFVYFDSSKISCLLPAKYFLKESMEFRNSNSDIPKSEVYGNGLCRSGSELKWDRAT